MTRAIVMIALAAALVSQARAEYGWAGDPTRKVGVILEKVRCRHSGVEVAFWSDQPGPYLVGVYLDDVAGYGMPRWPVMEVETSEFNAFVEGDFENGPYFVCVIVKDLDPRRFGKEKMTPGQLSGYLARREQELGEIALRDRGRWDGTHSAADGSFVCVGAFGKASGSARWTPPVSEWRSDRVYLPTGFVSLSAHGGRRYNKTTDGYRYWQTDTETEPDRIDWGGR